MTVANIYNHRRETHSLQGEKPSKQHGTNHEPSSGITLQTSMRADSGDKGFPSSQTTKSETSSTTPEQHETTKTCWHSSFTDTRL